MEPGTLVEYRYNSKSNWKPGRIREVGTNPKGRKETLYAIETHHPCDFNPEGRWYHFWRLGVNNIRPIPND